MECIEAPPSFLFNGCGVRGRCLVALPLTISETLEWLAAIGRWQDHSSGDSIALERMALSLMQNHSGGDSILHSLSLSPSLSLLRTPVTTTERNRLRVRSDVTYATVEAVVFGNVTYSYSLGTVFRKVTYNHSLGCSFQQCYICYIPGSGFRNVT